jgi:hypothetical protein
MELYPPVSDTTVIIVEHDSIVVKDTTIYIQLPGQTVYDTVQVIIKPKPVKIDTAYAETSLAVARSWYEPPNLILKLTQKDTTIEQRLENAIREAYYWKEKYETINTVVEVKKIPLLYKVAFYAIIGQLILLLYAIVRRRLF